MNYQAKHDIKRLKAETISAIQHRVRECGEIVRMRSEADGYAVYLVKDDGIIEAYEYAGGSCLDDLRFYELADILENGLTSEHKDFEFQMKSFDCVRESCSV